MADVRLYRPDDGFDLGTWDDERRIASARSRVKNGQALTDSTGRSCSATAGSAASP